MLLRFFRWFCHRDLLLHIEGDLMELYYERLKKYGKRHADLKFNIDVVLLCRPGIIRPMKGNRSLNQYDMYRNYLKVALRNLLANKSFSFINISGLAVGLASCIMIILYVLDETSYDKHHAAGDRVYRIASEVRGEKWVANPAPLAEALKRDFPEVEDVTRLLRFPGAEKMLLKNEENKKQFFETNGYYVDTTFFRIFTYQFKFGDKLTALNEPNSIVISEHLADKFFGNENPVDKTLKVGLTFGEFSYTVKGVLRDSEEKSHIPANFFLSMKNGDIGGWVDMQTNWAANSIFHTYVKLHEGSNPVLFERKLPDFLERNGGADFKAAGFTKELFIQPLKDIYLHSNFGFEVATNGNIRYVYIFTTIAIFLLAIACINFMNLSTARSEKRAREVGMRKVIGAGHGSLVSQFLSESMLITILGLGLAVVLVEIALPAFSNLTKKELSLLQIPNLAMWTTALTVVTGLLAGMYPAFYLSSFKPISMLRGKRFNTISAVAIRKGLVVFQFTISIALILGAILTRQQMEFLRTKNLGFNQNQKIVIPIQTGESHANINTLKNNLRNHASVISVAIGGAYPGIESVTAMRFYGEGQSSLDFVDIQTMYTEDGYIETLGIKLLQGRSFSHDFANDTESLVLNETAVRELGYSLADAAGRKVFYEFQNEKREMKIIGVVADYHYQSLHQRIKPLALTVSPVFNGPTSYLIADVGTSDYGTLINDLQDLWHRINPNSPFGYSFLDQDFQKNYEKEERTAHIVTCFTIIAIVIACLGLFGLSAFTAEQRFKEIGVRKVLGANVGEIVSLLSKDFITLIIIAIAISSPVAWYFMNEWLQGFAYRIGIEWWVFIASGAAAVTIGFFTLSFQVFRAARSNPVASLKSE